MYPLVYLQRAASSHGTGAAERATSHPRAVALLSCRPAQGERMRLDREPATIETSDQESSRHDIGAKVRAVTQPATSPGPSEAATPVEHRSHAGRAAVVARRRRAALCATRSWCQAAAWAFDGFRVNVPGDEGWYSLAKDAQYGDLAK